MLSFSSLLLPPHFFPLFLAVFCSLVYHPVDHAGGVGGANNKEAGKLHLKLCSGKFLSKASFALSCNIGYTK
jgi:hypothetical protein